MMHIAAYLLQNQFFLGTLCFLLIIVPILGIMKVHDNDQKP